jgi:hypothetical protein
MLNILDLLKCKYAMINDVDKQYAVIPPAMSVGA